MSYKKNDGRLMQAANRQNQEQRAKEERRKGKKRKCGKTSPSHKSGSKKTAGKGDFLHLSRQSPHPFSTLGIIHLRYLTLPVDYSADHASADERGPCVSRGMQSTPRARRRTSFAECQSSFIQFAPPIEYELWFRNEQALHS